MKAIFTRYYGPGYSRGSRIVAQDSDGNKVRLPLNPEWTNDQAHIEAAHALVIKMGWRGSWVMGGNGNDRNVFVDMGNGPVVVVK